MPSLESSHTSYESISEMGLSNPHVKEQALLKRGTTIQLSSIEADCTLVCRVAQVLAEHMKVPVVRSEMILEGGSVHTDCEGCVL